jgi:hypothetical protein
MNVLIAGVAFWILTIVVLVRLVAIGRSGQRLTLVRAIFWIVVLAVAIGLYFRPHEDIFGGQDGGAYLNFGARLAQRPHLSWEDKLLSEVPPGTREQFFAYGFNRPYLSKFACGRIKDFDRSIVTVWFQPACPVVMSIAARLGSYKLVLFVIPLFALLTAFSLRAVAARTIPHPWAGNIAFCLFLLNPIVLWHGRAPRPELIASFLLFAGAALLLNAWQAGRWKRWVDLVLGAACIGLAPFFHITAGMLVLPAALIISVVILSGREDFFLFPLIQAVALVGFGWQTLNITDTYSLRRFVVAGLDFWQPLTSLFLCLLMFLAGGCFVAKKQGKQPPRATRAWAGFLVAAVVIAAYAGCFFLAMQTPPSKENPFTTYIYRTDFKAVLNMISLPVGVLGLAGLAVFAALPGSSRRERWAVLLFAVPATLMIGNLYDFFMTRYTVVALMPMLALGLTALVTLIPAGRSWQRSAALACVAGIALLSLNGRTHFARAVEYRGLTNFLQSFADPVKKENGILLFEYSRIATPFEHMFGIPTLGIPNERNNDYTQMLKAWESIMRAHPNRPAFFMTPFQPPFSDRFVFTPVKTASYTCERLRAKRWDLPEQPTPWAFGLTCYRMTLRDRADSDAAGETFPFSYAMDAGNMGLRGFISARSKPWKLPGVRLEPGRSVSLVIPENVAAARPRELLFFVLRGSSDDPARLNVGYKSSVRTTNLVHLANDWWLARIDARGLKAGSTWTISSDQPVFLADAVAAGGKDFVSLMDAFDPALKSEQVPADFGNRWAQMNSKFCLPTPQGKEGYVLAFLLAPDEVGPVASLRLALGKKWQSPELAIPTGRWLWCAWPVHGPRNRTGTPWLELQTDKPLNPPDSQDSLVALIGYLGSME